MLKVLFPFMITLLSASTFAQTDAKRAFEKAKVQLGRKIVSDRREAKRQEIKDASEEMLAAFSNRNQIDLSNAKWDDEEDLSHKKNCEGCRLSYRVQNGYVFNSSKEPCRITVYRQHLEYARHGTEVVGGQSILTVEVVGVCVGFSQVRHLFPVSNRSIYDYSE